MKIATIICFTCQIFQIRNDTCARDVNSGNNSALVARNAQTQIDFLRSAGTVHLRTMRLIFRMNFDEQISLIT